MKQLEYESLEIRRIAAQFQRCAASVQSASRGDLQQTLSGLPSKFEGDAATTLIDKLEMLQADLKSISGGLEGISRNLIAYAREIEEADRQASAAIKSH